MGIELQATTVDLRSNLPNLPNLPNFLGTRIPTNQLPLSTHRIRPQTRTRPPGPGTCGKGKGFGFEKRWVWGGLAGFLTYLRPLLNIGFTATLERGVGFLG